MCVCVVVVVAAAGQCHPGQEEGDDKNAMEEEGTQCVRLYDHLVYIYIYLNKFSIYGTLASLSIEM